MPVSREPFHFGGIHAWIDGEVRAVDLTLRAGRIRLAPVEDGSDAVGRAGWLVLPGMINAHDHLHLNGFPDALGDAPYRHADDWVDDMRSRIESPDWRRIRRIPAPERAWQGGIKNLAAGATTVVHHDPWLEAFEHEDFPVHVVRDLGWAHSVGLGTGTRAGAGYGPCLAEALAAADPARPFMLHLGEGRDDRAAAEIGQLERLGGLRAGTALVHGIGIDESGRRRAIAAGAALVFCPRSNQRLIGVVADPRGFLDRGRVALGTDARLTGSRDLLDELKVARDVVGCDPARLLRLVFDHAAQVVGRPESGRIADGAPADLLWLRPGGDAPAEALIGARRAELGLVLRDGRPMIGDPDFAPLFAALAEPWLDAELDGAPKIVSRRVFEPHFRSGAEEPGLRLRRPPKGSLDDPRSKPASTPAVPDGAAPSTRVEA